MLRTRRLTLLGHHDLDELECGFVFAQVIRHVPVCVYCQQIRSTTETHKITLQQRDPKTTQLRLLRCFYTRRDAPAVTVGWTIVGVFTVIVLVKHLH